MNVSQGFKELWVIAHHRRRVEAFYPLAVCFYDGLGTHPDKATAYKWFERAALEGEQSSHLTSSTVGLAQFRTGWMLAKGEGVTADPQKSLKYFQLAAAKDNRHAQYMLGLYYHHGLLVHQVDLQRAKRLYERSAQQGLVESQAALGILLGDHLEFFADSAISAATEGPSFVLARNKLMKDAISWLSSAAEQNNTKALLRLGSLYEEGEWVAKDGARAFEYYKMAAAAADESDPAYALAHYFVGINYRLGDLGVKQDYAKAILHLTSSVRRGYAPAQRALGLMYAEGIGQDKDPQRAHTLFTQAALQGDVRALGLLAQQNQHGRGCNVDIKGAIVLYEKAALTGSVAAQLSLGELFHRIGRHGQALAWFVRAAAQPPVHNHPSGVDFDFGRRRQRNTARLMVARYRLHGWGDLESDQRWAFQELVDLSENEEFADAHFWVAACYEEGVPGVVEQDAGRAFEYYEKAAHQNDLDGQFQVALMLANGTHVPKNIERAFEWYTKAADRGHRTAQYSLGLYHSKGLAPLTAIDTNKAKSLFERAALQDHPAAMVSLAQLLIKDGTSADIHEGLCWLRKAAAKGDTAGLRELAAAYEAGLVATPDNSRYQVGFQLLKKATDKNDPLAWCAMARYHENGWAVPKSLQEALGCLTKAEALGYSGAGLAIAEMYERQSMWDAALEKYNQLAKNHGLLTKPGWKARLGKGRLVVFQNKGSQSDYNEVHMWLRDMVQQNAEAASIEPFEMLGFCCEQGKGTVKDINEAMVWYAAAVQQKTTKVVWIQERARFRLARLCVDQNKHVEALQYFRQFQPCLSQMNHESPETRRQARQVRYYLGYLLLHGHGVTPDVEEAKVWMRQAADEGEGAAAYELGLLAAAEDEDHEAKTRYDQGVSAGHAGSMRELALLFEREHRYDLNWDSRDTLELLERSAQLGDTEALVQLGIAHEQGMGCTLKPDLMTALRFYVAAAQQDHVSAMVKAGDIFHVMGRYYEAAAWFKKASTHPLAQVMLASYRLQGRGGVLKNEQAGFDDLQAAIACKDTKNAKALSLAYFLLGQCCETGRGTLKDVAKAKTWYKQSVDADEHVEAMWRLGVICTAEGDDTGGLEWYHRAAEKNRHCEAQFQLGLCHAGGLAGLEVNLVAARKYLTKAADQGHAQAKYELGKVLWRQDEFQKAVQLYESAGVMKVAAALRELGHLYHEGFSSRSRKGICVIVQNYKRAFALYFDAAQLDDATAALMVGTYFEDGYLDEFGSDHEQALKWYEKAHRLGCGSLAELAIGKLKHTMAEGAGEDETDDLREDAYKWFESASSTQAFAKVMVALYHLNGWGRKEREPSKGFDLLLQIAESGGSEAFIEVAKCYEEGIGVDRDLTKAMTYWELAAEMDDVDALIRLGEYYENGWTGQADVTEANKYYKRAKTIASSSTSAPSAPSIEEATSPPAYEDLLRIAGPGPSPPSNKRDLAGYVRDSTTPNQAFNPSAEGTGDYNPTEPLLQMDEEAEFQGRPPPPDYSIYRAPFQTQEEGIISRDDHLNRDGEALAQFLYEHNTPPKMSVRFYGFHEETHWRSRSSRDSNGNLVEEREPVSQTVEDFDFMVDCSGNVSSECQGVYVMPDPKSGQVKTVRQLCDDYIHEHNQLKELQLTKVVEWNYAELTQALTAAIHAHGYCHHIHISYVMKNYKITVKTSSQISRMADHWLVRLLCFVSCLWIVAWPVLWLWRKKFGHATLKSEWLMAVTERDWYNTNIREVLNQVPRGPTRAVPFML
ncbi:hypothetical protein DFQ28_000107 [Apophysomyces sp. BC1034]|nr:hypothetical protein DFQ29_008597 [Apophysomyces sp. BC1021]KAG0194409.1 hypothetical protein DFQ28_000107 [Apophysomyces sp. BC1034]